MYLGELVQFKRRKINYKSKRRITVPEEERYICKGTHEAIIDEESFNAVQNILKKINLLKVQNTIIYLKVYYSVANVVRD